MEQKEKLIADLSEKGKYEEILNSVFIDAPVPNYVICKMCNKALNSQCHKLCIKHLRLKHPEVIYKTVPKTEYAIDDCCLSGSCPFKSDIRLVIGNIASIPSFNFGYYLLFSEATTSNIKTQTSTTDGSFFTSTESLPNRDQDFKMGTVESLGGKRKCEFKTRSECWKLFKSIDGSRAQCGYCSKIVSYKKGMNSNLHRHLQMKHEGLHHTLRPAKIAIEATTGIIKTQTSLADGPSFTSVESLPNTAQRDLKMDWIKVQETAKEQQTLAEEITLKELYAMTDESTIQELQTIAKEAISLKSRKTTPKKPLMLKMGHTDGRELNVQNNESAGGKKKRECKTRSECWKLFTKIDATRAQCGYCSKIVSFQKGINSNLQRHLQMEHEGLYRTMRPAKITIKDLEDYLNKKEPPPKFDKFSKRKLAQSIFPVVDEPSMPSDIVNYMEEAHNTFGFVPNTYQAMSHRPKEMRAYLTYLKAIMDDRPGSHLNKVDKEMIIITVSAFNKCNYFVVAHSAFFRLQSANKLLPDQIASNWETAELDKREKCILSFAMKLTKCQAIRKHDFQALFDQGLDLEDAWDIGSIVSFCALANRMAYLTNMIPNERFYELGRDQQS